MSVLTKVLVIILLLLSVVYLGVTSVLFAYRVDFKKQLEQEKKVHTDEVVKLTEQKKELQGKFDAATKDGQIKAQEIDNKNQTIKTNELTLTQTSKERDDLRASLQIFTTQMTELKNDVDKYRKDNENLTAQLKDANHKKEVAIAARESALQENANLKTECDKLKFDLNVLYQEHIDKLTELSELRIYLTFLQQQVKYLPSVTEVRPRLEGKILAVSEKYSIVTINLGSAHGLKVGDEFIVSRGSNFIADVKVDRVISETRSACRITLKDAPIEVNDIITTK